MSEQKIVCVVPTIRPERMESFKRAWAEDFARHNVTLVTVWDGDVLRVDIEARGARGRDVFGGGAFDFIPHIGDLFCRSTDACRNLGFAIAAMTDADYVLTLDDDVHPRWEYPSNWRDGPFSERHLPKYNRDPIADHLVVLRKRVPLGWMNTAHESAPYLRGFPYSIRAEAPVMLSHGVWDGVPDFDGETQLRLKSDDWQLVNCPVCTLEMPKNDTGSRTCQRCGLTPESQCPGIPHTLPYYVGPVPRGVLFPLCGMNVMIRREALPYFYFAPMGRDSGVVCSKCIGEGGVPDVPGFKCAGCNGRGSNLHRFADIFMGIELKRRFDDLEWAIYTGASTVYHSRASDPQKNFEHEKLGRQWLEHMVNPSRTQATALTQESGFEPPRNWKLPDGLVRYLRDWRGKRMRYETLIRSLLET